MIYAPNVKVISGLAACGRIILVNKTYIFVWLNKLG